MTSSTSSRPDPLAALIEAHLAGGPVNVPDELRAEFEQAVAAHGALRGMIDETLLVEPSPGPRLPPDVAGKYEIERELGHGGMGVVYLARQRSLNRRVALKVLRPGERTFGPLVQRFLDEAQHLAQLRHPNIVSIHEVGDAAGEPFFTMDFIDGETLAAVIARGPLTPTRAVDVLKQVAAAIQHAHRHGIIHRDLKPGNVLLDHAGQVFVTDFGLARNVSQESSLTLSGELLGTPQYMSPEQARGQTSLIGEATDIHALGLLLFEMLSGRAAFAAKSPADVLVKLLNEDPPPLRTLDRRIPRDLETICLKALQKSPASRYANVSAVLEDVRRYEAGEPLLARRSGVLTKSVRLLKRHWKVTTAVLVTAVLMALIAPRLFDKSVADLITWGTEELRDGRPEIALPILQRAWSRSDVPQRVQIVPLLAEAIRSTKDPKLAVDAALEVITLEPGVSFGPHDYLVASTAAMKARAETPNGWFEPPHHETQPGEIALRQLAAQRLAVFLDGATGTADQRNAAEETLRAIQNSLRGVRPSGTPLESFDANVRLPEGTVAELSKQAVDASLHPWERAKTLLAVARLHEAANDQAEALIAYQTALEHFRRVYPFVSGVVSDRQILQSGDVSNQIDAPECRLMRDVLDSIHRLDPAFTAEVTGGVRFHLKQSELLGSAAVTIRPVLHDERITNPNAGLHRHLATSVPLHADQPGSVRVLPGRYRLSLEGRSYSWNTPDMNPRLIELETNDWPKTIDITDQMTDLTITVRKLAEVTFTTPADGARLDLTKDAIAWTPIPGAVKYEIQLAAYADQPNPTISFFHSEATTEPSFRPAMVKPRNRETLRNNWTTGSTIGLRITAYDAGGRCIGTSLEERKYLVAVPL